MDEREYKRLDKKRKLKTASGYNCAKEIVAQTAIIADDYDKLKKGGDFRCDHHGNKRDFLAVP